MTNAQMIKKALKAYYPNETFSCRMKKETATVTWDNEVQQTEVERIVENMNLSGTVEFKPVQPQPTADEPTDTATQPHPEMQVTHGITHPNTWVFTTVEPCDDGMIDITARRAPDALQALVPMSDTWSKEYHKWYQGLYQISLDAIFGKYPHLKDMEHTIRGGQVIVTSETDPLEKPGAPSSATPAAVLDLIGATRAPEYGNDARRVKCESETQYQSILALDGQGIEVITAYYPFVILQPVLADLDEIKVGDYIVNRQPPRYGGFVFKMCPIPTVNKNGKVVDGNSGYECRIDTGGKRWIPEAAAVKAEPPAEIQAVIDEAQMDANTYNHRITVYHEFHEYGYAYSGYAYRTTSEWQGMKKEWTVDNKACGRSFIVEILPKK